MVFPISLCQRHPRYAVILFAFVLTTFVLLSPTEEFAASSAPSYAPRVPPAPQLPARIARAERRYQRMLNQRHDMIKKYGPSPTQVSMFPPDQEPWPAYTVWDFFPPVYNCPHELERIGDIGDGGKWVCGLSRLAEKPDCVVYSFGLDWDSSFEAELLERTRHCEIWGFDYTAGGFGKKVPRTQRHRTHFARVGLGAADSHGPADEPKMWTLRSLMQANGHAHIDLLHVDIEGWEFEVVKALVHDFTGLSTGASAAEEEGAEAGTPAAPLPFGQLVIEMHVWHQRFHDFLGWWELLEAAGLRPFMSEVNLVYANYNRQSGVELADYSFVNVRGDNVFVSDRALGAGADGGAEGAPEDPDLRTIRHAIAPAVQ
ncbi:methyltransferase domain-containing protein [Amylocystis lapponica]|nr:methyltransferase domain-containing protein [Amylocystis lapponica]